MDEDNMSRLHFAGGQLHAHAVLLRALIETHPDRRALRERFDELLQQAIAESTPTTVEDDYLKGLDDEAASLWE